jgi:hypothetical protein
MPSTTVPSLWFDAPPPVAQAANSASQQFMDLFNDPASWQVTAGGTSVFILTTPFVLQATDQQLQEVLGFLKQHHIALAMNIGMVPLQAGGAGRDVEGYNNPLILEKSLSRISSLGGTLDWVAMDTPLQNGHENPKGAQLSIADLANQVAHSVALIKAVFPNVQFADSEPNTVVTDLGQWISAFHQATGSSIALVNATLNCADPNWNSELQALVNATQGAGTALGVFGYATPGSSSNMSWTLTAEQHIAAMLADPAIRLDNIAVATWNPYPSLVAPEGQAGSLTHVTVEFTQIAPLYANHYFVGSAQAVATAVPSSSYVGSAVDAVASAPISVQNVQVNATGAAPGMTFAVVLTDQFGRLGATASGAGAVSGAGTGVLTVSGTLTDINAELASLTYTGAAAGTDAIDVTTYDAAGLVDDHQIAIKTATPIVVALPSGRSAATLYSNIFGHAPSAATLASAQARLAAGASLAQVAAPWLAQAQAILTGLFEQVEGQSPGSPVIATLAGALLGGESVAQIRASLAAAPAVQHELAAFFQSHYGQAATGAQLAALTSQLAAGTSLAGVEAPLLANSAAAATIGTLCQQVEGQAPSAGDLATQARALLNGSSLATIRGMLATSSVVQTAIADLYQHVYDQSPTAAQVAGFTGQIAAGATLAQIQAQFTAAAQSEVTGMFRSVLNRAPTAAELGAQSRSLVSGGVLLARIAANLADSPESAANLTRMYQQALGQAPTADMLLTLEQCLHASGGIPLTQLGTDLTAAVSAYQQITDQAVTDQALQPLLNRFLSGESLDQIRHEVATSPTVASTLQSAYIRLFGHAATADTIGTIEQALQAGAISMAAEKTALAAQAAADLPAVGAVMARQVLDANVRLRPLAAIALGDPDPKAAETAKVTISGVGGTLTGGAGGTLSADGGSFAAKGSVAAVQSALRALSFLPGANAGSERLSLTLTNGAGHGVTSTIAITEESLHAAATTTFAYLPAAGAALNGIGGADTFVFPAKGFGHDTITGFDVARDVIQLPKAAFASFADVQAHTTAAAGGALIALNPSDTIQLAGVAPASLHASDFKFV